MNKIRTEWVPSAYQDKTGKGPVAETTALIHPLYQHKATVRKLGFTRCGIK